MRKWDDTDAHHVAILWLRGHKLKEIGAMFGVSGERIRQVMSQNYRKVRGELVRIRRENREDALEYLAEVLEIIAGRAEKDVSRARLDWAFRYNQRLRNSKIGPPPFCPRER